jgi:hypothetical protein
MDTDQYSDEETARRVKAAIKGAFSGSPTPLKDIPKKNGESRAKPTKDPQRRLCRQRKNRRA